MITIVWNSKRFKIHPDVAEFFGLGNGSVIMSSKYLNDILAQDFKYFDAELIVDEMLSKFK